MIVTALTDCGKEKKNVYLDGQFAFVLYKGELSGCHIEEGKELSEEVYEKIIEEILWKRIRMRSLYLLKSMDRTEQQMREKLRQGFYPQILIDRVIAWLKDLRYLDDARYAENYIRYHKETKSRRLLLMELSQKGVDRETALAALADQEGPDEEVQIRRWIEKKGVKVSEATPKELNKLYGFLLRKGFSSHLIRKSLKGFEDFD